MAGFIFLLFCVKTLSYNPSDRESGHFRPKNTPGVFKLNIIATRGKKHACATDSLQIKQSFIRNELCGGAIT